jgi:zinc transport system substrate-binding protein
MLPPAAEPGASGTDADPHVWLDPREATRIASHMIAALEGRGLVRAGSLASRVDAFASEMKAAEAELQESFTPVRERPFFVMHDGYTHFVRRFGLNQAGAVALDEEHSPGARTLYTLRSRLREAGAVCLVTEPGVNPSLLRALTDGSTARVLALDPLALDAPATTQGFGTFLRDIGHRLANCLGGGIQETPTHD